MQNVLKKRIKGIYNVFNTGITPRNGLRVGRLLGHKSKPFYKDFCVDTFYKEKNVIPCKKYCAVGSADYTLHYVFREAQSPHVPTLLMYPSVCSSQTQGVLCMMYGQGVLHFRQQRATSTHYGMVGRY